MTTDINKSKLNNNPAITGLIIKLENVLSQCENSLVRLYILNNLSLSVDKLAYNYVIVINSSLNKLDLAKDWDEFIKYKNISGIYIFKNKIGLYSYECSIMNLFRRCFIEHKNNALTNTKKHKKFYSKVVKHS